MTTLFLQGMLDGLALHLKLEIISFLLQLIDMNQHILIKQFANRWYLYWADTNQTIASFRTQFEAYSARRFLSQQ